MSTAAQTNANRANSQRSTGPNTPEGKSAASRNAFRHGLASRQLIIQGEEPSAYDALLADLTAEHAPATVTEELLVTQMAQNFWFMQRCIRLHQDSFARVDMSKQVPVTSMPLLIRYETSASRAFHKALSTLLTLQKTRKKEQIGSVSQKAQEPQPEPPAPSTPAPPEASLPTHSVAPATNGYSLFDCNQPIASADQEQPLAGSHKLPWKK